MTPKTIGLFFLSSLAVSACGQPSRGDASQGSVGSSGGGTTSSANTADSVGSGSTVATRTGGGTSTVPHGCGNTYPAPTFPCSSPGACGFPDATSTGVPKNTTLTPMTGGSGALNVIEITTDGTVIDGAQINGSLDVWANNVTIKNSAIQSRAWWGINQREHHSGLTVINCTIHGTPGQGQDTNGGNDYGIADSGDGVNEIAFNEIESYGAPLSLGSGCVHDNYTHKEDSFQVSNDGVNFYWVHTDPFIASGGNITPLFIVHNTFINDDMNGGSASIGLFNDTGVLKDVTIRHNWMAGGAYCFYPCSSPDPGGSADGCATNEHVSDNVFSTSVYGDCGKYGPVNSGAWPGKDPSNTWSNNAWADGSKAGQLIPAQ